MWGKKDCSAKGGLDGSTVLSEEGRTFCTLEGKILFD
jgi:hypothetical protein